jgi:hypothetical protein
MNGINSAFFFVIEKIIELQSFFISQAWTIGRVVLIIALSSAALNYALTGTGFKENLIKILKAVVFFVVVMGAYPKIVSWITAYTFSTAKDSTYASMEGYFNSVKSEIALAADEAAASGKKGTYGTMATKSTEVSEDKNPELYFGDMMQTRNEGQKTEYTTVAPAAALRVLLLVAGECIRYSDESEKAFGVVPDFGRVLKGYVCAFFVLFTGVFAVLEYVLAFLEFMFISSVGIMLFPLSLWDGSKFMAEKFISALLGFFIKLLFCTICIFLMLYGFLSLAKEYTQKPFTGLVDQILMIIFVCLLFFYICKSAPGLAQSLLTGSPTLNAAGAIGAAASAVGAAAGVAGLGARATFAGAGAVSEARSASGAAGAAIKEMGGGKAAQIGAGMLAFGKSLAGSGLEAAKGAGGDMARSLMSRPLFGNTGGGSGGGGGAGYNRHSATQKFLQDKNQDGTKKTFGEAKQERQEKGENIGKNVAASLMGRGKT